jgi:hypothetical protein
MLGISSNYKKKLLHLIIESYLLFIGGIFISYYVNKLFDPFDEVQFKKDENKLKYWYLLFEIFIQITLLLFFAVIFKDVIKNVLMNLLKHNVSNVSMLSNISYTPALFIYQLNLMNKLRFIFKTISNKKSDVQI